jgi:TRAP-type C4-dicarboxylate transport system substrate-binding protein
MKTFSDNVQKSMQATVLPDQKCKKQIKEAVMVSRRSLISLCFAPLFISAVTDARAAEKFTYEGPPITVRFSHFAPATHPMSKAVSKKWIEMVEKESNGKIKVQSYMGGVLHSAKDGFKATVNDITDLTPAYTMYQAGSFHLAHVLDLPFAFPSAAVAAKVAEELYPKYFKKEYEAMGVYLANYNANGIYNLFTKKPVATLDDLKGMKIRAAGGTPSKIIRSLGAVPVAVPAPEAYNAFQRGVVDGVAFYDTGAIAYRIHELTTHLTEAKMNNPANAWAFNRKSWDSWPPEVKRFMYNMQRRLSMMYGIEFDRQDALSRPILEGKGIKIIKLSAEEMARWKAAAEPLWEEFIQENEAKGLPARELVKDLRALTLKYSGWTNEQLMKDVTENPVRGIIDGM